MTVTQKNRTRRSLLTIGTLRFYDAMIGDARPNLKNTGESNIICAAASGLKIFKFFVYLPTTRHFNRLQYIKEV